MAPHLQALLASQGLSAISDYLRAPSLEIAKAHNMPVQGWFIDQVDGMPEDDDINYTVLGLTLLQQHGAGFTSEHVATAWVDRIPLLRTFTAERAAYRNFLLNIAPPASATYRNPYREWIGAQIRPDAYGYLACGNPELAAEWAWRDARISHVKNGIYGAMWVAAMLAAAPYERDIPGVIRAGLAQIPAQCRLAEAIHQVFAWHGEGMPFEAVRARIHSDWTETNPHHWCHTISNAIIVAAALLWGEEDFGRTICLAVSCTFDTDCNGATCGSILGIRHGAARLPEPWTTPLNDTIETGLIGYTHLTLTGLARDTAACRGSLVTGH
jgi:ADP-ribosylglycohydrolase